MVLLYIIKGNRCSLLCLVVILFMFISGLLVVFSLKEASWTRAPYC